MAWAGVPVCTGRYIPILVGPVKRLIPNAVPLPEHFIC
ncbi:hypothetical protein XAP412_730092 [Xanthomonas phaseoli pv. phaseoli]|uniref:Uncharacterized protein n=1 Tax=Xanthomonas campestris pv. phaseoli TaxID=317013 RepID=A0AB38E5X8_XANCH|nr:hypothetical protein XAP6984_770090 [Xanthomonas phaseoli pv. phaseoli]SON89564.1 hypothetical protein XAP412_730092 [Xanthomonas phaseoli pv. phaseoli]SON92270.1 hypothetical protein XAP7430_730092 [Xanthomonas phaseoli pv. phaseoli]SOO29127.1 hypothetical protein XAP6164_3050015 [Xanthomonas phaseoli pv. phaseoli]